ncbi:hypothetical protein M8J75_016235 [Diaphorina citri]|nr:hypothetical protein M8J75_016235 [Diaphorina citri]
MEGTRLFVGNLSTNTTEADMRSKFSKYGKVVKIELKERKFLQPPSCFGFITLDAPRHSLENCIYELSNPKVWNGHPVTVDFAKESFLSRLEKERQDPKNKNILVENKSPETTTNQLKPTAKSNISVSQKQSESESSESDSEEENDNVAENNKRLKNNVKVSNQQNRLNEDSDSSESDCDTDECTTTKNNARPENKIKFTDIKNAKIESKNKDTNVKSNGFPSHKSFNKKNLKEDSESDSDTNVNMNSIVDQTNDVMKQFENFSSVWQDSSEDEQQNEDSEDDIFEAFKSKNTDTTVDFNTCDDDNKANKFPPAKFPEHKENKFPSSEFSGDTGHKISKFPEHTGNKISKFPEHGNKFPSRKFPEHKSSDVGGDENFVKFVKNTRTPNVQQGNAFSEVKLSKFPKFETKNKKIMFDSEDGAEVKTASPTSKFPSSKPSFPSKEPTITQSADVNLKSSKIKEKKGNMEAEMKRRNAMEERIKDISEKRKAIKQALANVDSQRGMNKKIIFSQDSDDEQTIETKYTTSNIQSKQSSSENARDKAERNADSSWERMSDTSQKRISGDTNQKRINGDTNQERINDSSQAKDNRKSLFSEDMSDSDTDSDSEREFKIKKQFEGEKGKKLLELQASYNNDTRFNLDDRFIEDEEEKDECKDNVVEEEDERVTQMQILENVLGYKVKQHQTKNGLLQILRFDPLNPNHKEMFVEVKQNKDKRIRRKRKLRDEPVEVSGEKFYQVDEEYFTSTKKDASKDKEEPFSLLKLLNREHDSDVEKDPSKRPLSVTQADYRTEPLGKSTNPFGSLTARFQYDSSNSEDEEEEEDERRRKKQRGPGQGQEQFGTGQDGAEQRKGQFGTGQDGAEQRKGQFGTGLAPPPSLSEKVFFSNQNDDRFKEAQEFWKQKPTSAMSGDSFKLKRRELALKLKTKIRRNLKNSTVSSGSLKRRKTTKMMKTQRRR